MNNLKLSDRFWKYVGYRSNYDKNKFWFAGLLYENGFAPVNSLAAIIGVEQKTIYLYCRELGFKRQYAKNDRMLSVASIEYFLEVNSVKQLVNDECTSVLCGGAVIKTRLFEGH